MTESVLNSSILITIKKLLGIADEDTSFDMDITIHINSALLTLNDLGVGTEQPFVVESKDQTWAQFIQGSVSEYESVKSYIYLKVKLIFDPPGTSFAIDAMQKLVDEYAWRLNVRAEGAFVKDTTLTTP